MTELIKTIVLVGITISLAVAALLSLPRTATQNIDEVRNKELFPGIDVEKVRRVRIVKFDGVAPETFEINKTDTGWVLPGEYDYPADDSSQSRINRVLRFLPDLVVTNVASDRDGDKEKFGVIEPAEAAENIGQKNVGTMIQLLDESEQPMASAVVGSRVEGDESKSFVLVPGRPLIYVVELEPKLLSIDFRDWINRDLLRFDPYRIANLSMRHVESAKPTADPTTGEFDPGINHDYQLTAEFRNGVWRLEEFSEFDEDGEPTEVSPKKAGKVDSARFTEMANTLADLKIADVQRKPAGLKADVVRDEDYIGKLANQISLREHGFYVVPGGPAGFRLQSKGGEMKVVQKDGVELLVRFGDFASASLDDVGMANRYAIISAQVNESMFPEPVRSKPDAAEDTGEQPPAPDDVDDEQEDDGPRDQDKPRDKEQEQIERDYLRQVELRKDKLAAAQAKAKRLNKRYLPWYYIIAEDAFNQLTPERSELLEP